MIFEIHLTIAPQTEATWPAVEVLASRLGAKLLVIELARGSHRLQPMLTMTHEGNLEQALQVAMELSRQESLGAFDVSRCKIEQALSPLINEGLVDGHYLEWHGRVAVEPSRLKSLADVCGEFGGHLSSNALRHSAHRYVTLREFHELGALRERVATLCQMLESRQWKIDKQQWERVVFDSNLALDNGWLEVRHES